MRPSRTRVCVALCLAALPLLLVPTVAGAIDTWSISGTVREEATSLPLEGAEVDAYGYRYDHAMGEWWEFEQFTETAADGTYTFGTLPSNDYKLWFFDWVNGHQFEFYNDVGNFDEATVLSVPNMSGNAGIDASLAEGASISGIVSEEGSGTLEGVYVTAYRWNGASSTGYWDIWLNTQTHADGSYEIKGLRPGNYKLEFFDPSWHHVVEVYNNKSTLEAGSFVTLSAGQHATGYDAALVPGCNVDRVAAYDRFSTAVEIARYSYGGQGGIEWPGVDDIVIASGDDRAAADPLAAAGLCSVYKAPLFLVSKDFVPDEVIQAIYEIWMLNGQITVHVVGGTVSVPEQTFADIEYAIMMDPFSSKDRILSGGSRYDLAAAIARRMVQVTGTTPEAVLVANGADPAKFFDALSLSTVSAAQSDPILLVSQSSVPAPTAAVLAELAASATPDPAVIVGGGPKTVSDTVVSSLGAERWAGASRYGTAVDIAEHAIDRGWLTYDCVGVAAKVPDALAGGSMMGMDSGVLLITAPTALPPETHAFLEQHKAEWHYCYIFGGSKSVQAPVVTSIDHCLH